MRESVVVHVCEREREKERERERERVCVSACSFPYSLSHVRKCVRVCCCMMVLVQHYNKSNQTI